MTETTAPKTAAEEARENFEVTNKYSENGVTWVRAEARTGSQYTVILTRLPHGVGQAEGGQHLISLIQPRQSSMIYTVFPGETIHADYVVEKLCENMRHGGDQMAVYLTVNAAIQHATEAGAL